MPSFRVLVLTIVALCAGLESAQAQEKASYSFTDNQPLRLDRDNTTAVASVQNDGKHTGFMRARVEHLRRVDKNGATPPADLVFKDPGDIEIPTGGTASVEVGLRSGALDQLAPGQYAAELVLTGQHLTRGPPVRKTIGLSVSSIALVPLRERIVFDGVDGVPIASAPDIEGIVPLAPAADGSAVTRDEVPLEPGQPIGAVSSADGEQATVVWTGELEEASPGVSALRVRALDLRGSGIFDGTLDLQPADPDAGEVALHVRVTDMALWPLAALALGIALAWACELFVRTAPPRAKKPWSRVAVDGGRRVLGRPTGHSGGLLAPGRSAFPTLSRGEVSRVRQALARIDIARRDDVRPELPSVALPAAGVAVDDRPPPFLAAGLATALSDPRPADGSTTDGRSPTVERTLELLEAWPALREVIWKLWSSLSAVDQDRLTLDAREKLLSADNDLRMLVLELQTTTSARGLSVPDLEERLSSVRAQLTEALAEPPRVPGTDIETSSAVVPVHFESEQMEASHREAARRRRSRLLEALAIVITLATGMATLYFGELFGEVEQYAAAVIWGFAVKVLCDLVLTVLTQLRTTGASPLAADT
jgi:hypothetical protein